MCRLRIGGAGKTGTPYLSAAAPGARDGFETNLADAGVSDKEKLEEVVVFAGVHCEGRWGRE